MQENCMHNTQGNNVQGRSARGMYLFFFVKLLVVRYINILRIARCQQYCGQKRIKYLQDSNFAPKRPQVTLENNDDQSHIRIYIET